MYLIQSVHFDSEALKASCSVGPWGVSELKRPGRENEHSPPSVTEINDEWNSSFERVEDFKYLGATLTNQNYIQEEIKGRLKAGNVCYHSVQNLLSFSLMSKNTKIKIYGTTILFGCETWSLTLREERRLRVLRRTFGHKRDEVTGEWRTLHSEGLNDLYSSPNIIWVIKSRRMRWAGHVARRG